MKLLPIGLFLITLITNVYSFTDYLLKDCKKDAFCHRNRHYAEEQAKSLHTGIYTLDKNSITVSENGALQANIIKTIERSDIDDIKITLPFTMSFITDENNNGLNALRFTVDEIRNDCQTVNVDCNRFNETWDWAVLDKYHNANYRSNKESLSWKLSEIKSNFGWFSSTDANEQIVIQNKNSDIKVEITINDFYIKVYYKDVLQTIVNERSLFNLEHHRTKESNFQNTLPFESTYNMFADDFEYSKFDTIPLGPESVSLDFTLINYDNVYGIPEHADSLRLKDTQSTNTISKTESSDKQDSEKNSDPYRLFNVDVFEYNVDSKQPMYGSIPLMIAARPGSSMGLLWLNPSDTWIDINYHSNDTKAHWMSENGVIDVTLFFGEHPKDITNQYIQLTGSPVLPQLSAIGYHQCRWNYNNELDVLTVEDKLDKGHFPFDFIWLDLDYTDKKQYFTWNPETFPNPTRLLQKLGKLGRQLAILIDPHLLSTSEISKRIIKSGTDVKNNAGRTFLGQCWPGQSIWIDTISYLGKIEWSNIFQDYIAKYIPVIEAKNNNLHFWNDMNEPSVFSGPETTAPKDLLHDENVEERSIHNLYGLSVHEATYDAVKEEYNNLTRPFVLTRAFFAGSQRSAATWTGDNVANWEYLRISVPMVLTNNIVGMPFIGADVAGFSGDPDPELIVRWYQAGLWYPFFRAHAHIDTKRREPYLFEEPVKSIVRDAIQLRYKLLPTFYTAFYKASVNGYPIMNPMFYEKAAFTEMYDIDDQFYLSDSGIIVKPVVSHRTEKTSMILAPGIYYDLETLNATTVSGDKVSSISVNTPLEKIPAFIEGGHIVTEKVRYRRSSHLMARDPYTFIIAPDFNDEAQGSLYVDDGKSFEYENGQYLETSFKLSNGIISNKPSHLPITNDISDIVGNALVETIIIPTSESNHINVKELVKVKQGLKEWNISVEHEANTIVIKNPLVHVDKEWTIVL
ncbi:glucosidase 2 subunit alpha [Monosporozyma servazzii]